MTPKLTGAQIRQTYIDFFSEHGHTFVPSMSLVPGEDATLLFTNAGMVQFKDVFLGTDKRAYKRAANSQKCMRVAGKHNDLDDVGRDDTHHTFFEMLGNWSFGDYYKKEAIEWAWQLLTDIWGLPKERMWATCFKDDKGNVPTDDEAVTYWRSQPGMDPGHVLFFGRKDNFWEMAETGPCGPCSEIHIDRGEEYCNLKGQPHTCAVNGDCTRYLELWNLVFIQYNRLGPDKLEPLPATHVDTGMGFERIVSVLQEVDSNYKTDLFAPMLETLRALTGRSLEQVYTDFTPYRVIADHARAASFLIADGVVPGNTGRNYICRMIIRRASRFGSKLGLHEPFLSKVAEAVVATYGEFYTELIKHRKAILDNLRREEIRFARTVESGTAVLDGYLAELRKSGKKVLSGENAFDLYATYGLPFEIARDIAREQNLEVDEAGFRSAMDEHRLASGAGQAMGALGGEDAELFSSLLKELQGQGKLGESGVRNDPYNRLATEGPVLVLYTSGQFVQEVYPDDEVEVILPETGFYIESGGQVSDTGSITAKPDANADIAWGIQVTGMRKPSAGMLVHAGVVSFGMPKVGDSAVAKVDAERRHDIMRNHTATHLLHAALHQVLGEMARQAGSLVAPDRLRFDFTHPEAMTPEQLEQVEKIVNNAIAADMLVTPVSKSREQAIAEGAMALFGEKYGETVRTITIMESGSLLPKDGGSEIPHSRHSYELCGGTHLERTSDVGAFIITSEGSTAAGVRRIEAVTGRGAYELIARRFKALKEAASLLSTTADDLPRRINELLDQADTARKQLATIRRQFTLETFNKKLSTETFNINGTSVLSISIPDADVDALRNMTDIFRNTHKDGVIVLGTIIDDRPMIVASSTTEAVTRGLNAGELVKNIAPIISGSGGGRPNLAQAGGKDSSKLDQALSRVSAWVKEHQK